MAGARLQGSAGVGTYVYRHDPATDETSIVADSFNKPNGLAFSPDESVLYVTDTGANQAPGTYFVGLPHRVRALRGAGFRLRYCIAEMTPIGTNRLAQ